MPAVFHRYLWFFSILCLCGIVSFRLFPVPFAKQLTADGSTVALPIISDNWVATDALGRTLATPRQAGAPRSAKYVGMFYFLWQGEHYDAAIHDLTKIRRANPASPAYGPEGAFHWWGEPEAGYFRADDPWVIRRNLQLLVNAGIDVLFLDITNGSTYLPTVRKLCQIALSMRQQGIPAPSICFVTYTKTAETINDLYANFYAPRQFDELWFRWQGKPLMLGKQDDVPAGVQRDFFTWRYSWAWTNSRNEPRHWQWLDDTPQDYGWDQNHTVPEEIPVGVAGHPIRNIGKSYAGGKQAALNAGKTTGYTGQGRYFAEQWQRALAVNPSMILVAGWNEWIAQRYKTDTDSTIYMGSRLRKGTSIFIDLYNEEFNRDIEPMKGGYNDNYYYQLVSAVRRFKGVKPMVAAGQQTNLSIDGKFTDWVPVKPLYQDWPDDVQHRNWPRFDKKVNLVNTTGRNDFIAAKTAFTSQSVLFWIKTAKAITKSTDKNWMLLLVNADNQQRTGWNGYDLLVNQPVINQTTTTVSRWQGGRWRVVGNAPYRVVGDQMEVALPRTLFGNRPPQFAFHWIDNASIVSSLTSSFTDGDCAPDRRFNYAFVGR